jgi:hypothetical protein
VANSFIVRLRCPHWDQDGRLVLKDREEALIQVLATPWDFECTVHGVQRALPLEQGKSAGHPHTWSCPRLAIEIRINSDQLVAAAME